ncbi:MAG: hypothetical protein C5B49_06040 [Bdellovibrio sp.]|nr:MAG: hypothetical protein C5B49_06040 [Bdellovibrio sp.]
MKKYLCLIAGSLGAFCVLVFLFSHSGSSLSRDHQNILNFLQASRQVDTAVDRDLLKSRSFLLLNYDSLVESSDDMEKECVELKSGKSQLRRSFDGLEGLVSKYCDLLNQNTEDVEEFKSKVAVFKNSLAYIRQVLARPSTNLGRDRLLAATISYSIFPNSETEENLRALMSTTGCLSKAASIESDLICRHVARIHDLKPALDQLTERVLNSARSDALENLRASYLEKYASSLKQAEIYRVLLLGTSMILLVLVFYGVISLIRVARQLKNANKNLKKHVETRTSELADSKNIVLQQQQILVSSAKLSALGEMAGQIAHEINTPLGAIVLTVQSLRKKIESQLQTNSALSEGQILLSKMDFILQVTNKIARIVGSMRKLAGHGANEQICEVSVNTLIEDVLLLCEGRFKKSGIEFTYTNRLTEHNFIQCRPNEVAQVLVNLLNNAHDAIKDKKPKWIKLDLQESRDRAIIRVIDSGSGIAESVRAKLFLPNFTTKSLDSGTGFGLSICKKLVESHRGRIYLDSEQANTTFVVELPFEQTEALAKAA